MYPGILVDEYRKDFVLTVFYYRLFPTPHFYYAVKNVTANDVCAGLGARNRHL